MVQDLAPAFQEVVVEADCSKVCLGAADLPALPRDRILLQCSVDQQATPHRVALHLTQFR